MVAVLALVACGDGGEESPVETAAPSEQEIMAASGYACLLTDGAIECQLNGDAGDPGVTTPPAAQWNSVVHGSVHLCGFTAAGEPKCWGWNYDGQVDIPEDVAIASFFLGTNNTCVIETDGGLACWGNEWTGLNEAPEGSFVMGAAGESTACARSEDLAWACWGERWGTQYGSYEYDWTLPEEPLVSLESSSSNFCGLGEDGTIYCWGRSSFGVTQPPEGTGYHNLSVGRDHACVQEPDDEVLCWGDVEIWRSMPEGQWRDFDAGTWVDCGIRYSGEIDCWGCAFTDPFDCDWDE